MFNFHEKFKKQIGTGFGANWGRSLVAPYPDNNLHAIITVSSYI